MKLQGKCCDCPWNLLWRRCVLSDFNFRGMNLSTVEVCSMRMVGVGQITLCWLGHMGDSSLSCHDMWTEAALKCSVTDFKSIVVTFWTSSFTVVILSSVLISFFSVSNRGMFGCFSFRPWERVCACVHACMRVCVHSVYFSSQDCIFGFSLLAKLFVAYLVEWFLTPVFLFHLFPDYR